VLATLVIGLREGLEAALIVGIIAAFLRSNGQSLRPMWLGVGLAVLLSLVVGIGLDLVEQSLPQAAQEAMESVIGAVAVVFVTTMLLWMTTHARGMKRELEADAAVALGRGSGYALAVMAFLAVLKEGFETSVFLLATFSAAQSAALAVSGAVIGVLIAVAVGWGIYAGGVRLDLSRFFRFTGVFLILVAAGLVIATLRSAHEAGWLDAGQQATVNLGALVAPGTIQSALITGVLGIPADPRLVEVLGWFGYLVPVALVVFWPAAHRPRGRALLRLQTTIAAGLGAVAVVLAIVLAIALPGPTPDVPASAPLTPGAGTAALTEGGATLQVSLVGAPPTSIPLTGATPQEHDGVAATAWTRTDDGNAADAPRTLTLAELTTLAGGRLPVGFSPQEHPGPFDARWTVQRTTTIWTAGGVLLDAARQTTAVVAISGGGLQNPRTISVGAPDDAPDWAVTPVYRDRAAAAVGAAAVATTERSLWAVDVPVVLGAAAVLVAAAAARTRRRLRRTPDPDSTPTTSRPLSGVPADRP
jgi:high-affinity iron transporter